MLVPDTEKLPCCITPSIEISMALLLIGVNAALSFVKAYVVPPLNVMLSSLDILSTCSKPLPK